MSKLDFFLQSLLDWIFPFTCVSCRATLQRKVTSIPLCDACTSTITVNRAGFCSRCRARLPVGRKPHRHSEKSWRLFALTNYQNPTVERIIKAFKYLGMRNLEPLFQNLINDFVRKADLALSLSNTAVHIIPIPLHYTKYNERGFNQSEVLACLVKSALEKHSPLEIILDNKLLIRRRKTKSQAKIQDKASRQSNVAGCFKSRTPILDPCPTYLIIDDVCTSLATIEEARRTLKKAGAKKIICLVFALA